MKNRLELRLLAVTLLFMVLMLTVSVTLLVLRYQTGTIIAALLFSTLLLGLLFWFTLKKMVIAPLQILGNEAAKMSEGDLTFAIDQGRGDTIGRLQEAIRGSLCSVSSILKRVTEVTGRVSNVAVKVEKESERILESTERETSAIAEISSSVLELNASISEIAENVEGLAASAEVTATSMIEMAASIQSVGSIVHDLSAGVLTTGSSIEELSATLREVANGADELASVSDTTLSAVEQIIASIADIEQKVKESSRLSRRVTEEASTIGVASMEQSAKGMERIKGAVENTAGVLKKLGGRSEEIGEILTVIDEVTKQTTLLALNAAILSAQAGAQGKGFSVVAGEMKDLAGRTAGSTREIAALIAAVRSEVKTAVESMDEALESVDEGSLLSREAADSFGKILESARTSSEMTLSIERTTGEQAQAAMLVTTSVEKVRQMVQRMAQATAEQSTGISLIMAATEKIREASLHVRNSSDQQMLTSGMISKEIEAVSNKSRQIERSINEQKQGTGQILCAVEIIKEIPKQSRDIAFKVNRTLREVVKDVELIKFEMSGFKLHSEDPTVLRFGILPQESPVEMYKRYAPLARYLTDRLGRKVELRVAPNFETALQELGDGVTSLCSMTSMVYIEAQKHYGAEALATVMRNGKAYQHSVIVAKTDGRVKALKELKGKSFAFVDEKAATGYVVPRAMLLAEGVDLPDLSYFNFTGAHDEVARGVLRGDFDAGGLMESIARRYLDQGLTIIKVSERVPEWNICCRNLDPALKAALKQALLGLDEKAFEAAAVLHSIEPGCTGFAGAADDDHNGMRGMMKQVGML